MSTQAYVAYASFHEYSNSWGLTQNINKPLNDDWFNRNIETSVRYINHNATQRLNTLWRCQFTRHKFTHSLNMAYNINWRTETQQVKWSSLAKGFDHTVQTTFSQRSDNVRSRCSAHLQPHPRVSNNALNSRIFTRHMGDVLSSTGCFVVDAHCTISFLPQTVLTWVMCSFRFQRDKNVDSHCAQCPY